jgi:hypothetical protein
MVVKVEEGQTTSFIDEGDKSDNGKIKVERG